VRDFNKGLFGRLPNPSLIGQVTLGRLDHEKP
jgi:hypothetical protein